MSKFICTVLLGLCGVYFISALMESVNPPHTYPTLQPHAWEIPQTLDTIRPRHKPPGAAYAEEIRLEREKAAQQELERKLAEKNRQHQTATSYEMKTDKSANNGFDRKTQARLDALTAETLRKLQPEIARIKTERDRLYDREIARIDAELDRMMWGNTAQGGYNYDNHRKLQNLITDMEMHYNMQGNSGLQYPIPYTVPYGYAW